MGDLVHGNIMAGACRRRPINIPEARVLLLYPIRFEPMYRRYLWGGRRLATVLGKSLGDGDDFAESWEVVDHGADQSRVAAGPLRGNTLRELVSDRGQELFGRHAPQPQFPLLFKFLDAQQNLSVQVHPDNQQAAKLDPPDLGKSEAWIILHAEPGSVIYAGLKRGFDRAALEREVDRNTTALCLHRFEPKVGDCIFIPAGTVHALGAGLVVAEIQQASDTTYRLFDWNRVGPDGKPRQLHIQQALNTIDYGRGPVLPQAPRPIDGYPLERLVECEHFMLDRWSMTGRHMLGGDQRFHLLSVVSGEVVVAGDPSGQPLTRGQTLLLPASCGKVSVTAPNHAVVLDMYLP